MSTRIATDRMDVMIAVDCGDAVHTVRLSDLLSCDVVDLVLMELAEDAPVHRTEKRFRRSDSLLALKQEIADHHILVD